MGAEVGRQRESTAQVTRLVEGASFQPPGLTPPPGTGLEMEGGVVNPAGEIPGTAAPLREDAAQTGVPLAEHEDGRLFSDGTDPRTESMSGEAGSTSLPLV